MSDTNIDEILMDLWVTDPHKVPYTDVLPEAKAQIKQLITEARVDENQRWLKTTSFGALTGDLEKRLAALQGEE